MSIKDFVPSATIEEAQLAYIIAEHGHAADMLNSLDLSTRLRVLAMSAKLREYIKS